MSHPTPLHRLRIIPVFILCAIASTAFAGEKLDLERVRPVPDNQPIPVQDFFRPGVLQDPTVNPTGTHIAALIAAKDDHTSLMVYDLKTQKEEYVGTRGDSDVDYVRWLTDNRLAYIISIKKLGGFIFAGARVGSLQISYPILQNISGNIIAVPPNDRTHPLVHIGRHTEVTGQYGEVMSVNAALETGTFMDVSNGYMSGQRSVEENVRHISNHYPTLKTPDGFDLRYFADKEGRLEFGETSTNGMYSLHHLVGENWEKCPEDLDAIHIIGNGDKPGELVVLGARKDNKPRALEVIDGATGQVVDTLVQDKAYDCNAWLYRDPVSHLIVGAIYDRAGPAVVWFNEDYRNLQKLVDGLFPGQIVRIIGNDEAGKMVLISVFSDRQPAVYSWVDLQQKKAGLIGGSMPWIDAKRMQPMNVMRFKTRDGRQLDAYVTMPAGASKQNPPPLVVLPHRSQGWRDTWGYNAEVQFLASRGYAVLQPNYRGGWAGSSWMFPIEDEWAFRKMADDVTDATKTIIGSGLVDRNRVAIMGTDFGGYVALSGAAFEPGLYRCAVAISAVADWAKLIEDYRHNKFSGPYFTRMVLKLGDPKTDPEKWDAISPLRHADQIRCPVFVAWGEYDAPMTIIGMKDLASTVEKNHIPVESISFLNEADGVNHLGHKVELYSRIEAFLAKNLGPGQPPTAAAAP
jgi:pimeloyl-ACP methyl ester carboxylesterase